jgi:hypothetical protein
MFLSQLLDKFRQPVLHGAFIRSNGMGVPPPNSQFLKKMLPHAAMAQGSDEKSSLISRFQKNTALFAI